jgi:NADH-quinone oxidoreductase subunit L
MLVNRVGDIGLALSICVTFLTYKSVDYALIFALTPVILNKSFIFFGFDINILTVITILIF